jgi:4-amino-4-deoxy-L-arabinose transferase-like glycosyltransferase
MFIAARLVLTDSLLLCGIQGAISCYLLALLTEGRQRLWWLKLMWVALAVGVLTKGPIGLVLPCLVVLPWHCLNRNQVRDLPLRSLLPLTGIVAFLLLVVPWYAAAHWVTNGAFTWQFFIGENVFRYTQVVNQHRQPFWFYILLLVPMTFPWTGYLPAALGHAWRRTRETGSARLLGLFLWQIVAVLLLFSCSETKVWTYTLPLFPPLAILVGCWLRFEIATGQGRLPTWPLFLTLIGGLATAFAVSLHPLDFLPIPLQHEDLLIALRILVWCFTGVSLGWLVIHVWARAWLIPALTAGLAVLYLGTMLWIMPQVDRVWTEPVRGVAQAVEPYPEAKVVTYFVHELGLNYHTRRQHVCHLREGDLLELADGLHQYETVFVASTPENFAELSPFPLHVWWRTDRLILVSSITPGRAP